MKKIFLWEFVKRIKKKKRRSNNNGKRGIPRHSFRIYHARLHKKRICWRNWQLAWISIFLSISSHSKPLIWISFWILKLLRISPTHHLSRSLTHSLSLNGKWAWELLMAFPRLNIIVRWDSKWNFFLNEFSLAGKLASINLSYWLENTTFLRLFGTFFNIFLWC